MRFSRYPYLLRFLVTKDELRLELERQALRFKEIYGGEVTLYAPAPKPDRKPWRKRKNLLDQAFEAEIEKEKKRQAEN